MYSLTLKKNNLNSQNKHNIFEKLKLIYFMPLRFPYLSFLCKLLIGIFMQIENNVTQTVQNKNVLRTLFQNLKVKHVPLFFLHLFLNEQMALLSNLYQEVWPCSQVYKIIQPCTWYCAYKRDESNCFFQNMIIYLSNIK